MNNQEQVLNTLWNDLLITIRGAIMHQIELTIDIRPNTLEEFAIQLGCNIENIDFDVVSNSLLNNIKKQNLSIEEGDCSIKLLTNKI